MFIRTVQHNDQIDTEWFACNAHSFIYTSPLHSNFPFSG